MLEVTLNAEEIFIFSKENNLLLKCSLQNLAWFPA